jgi:hypothetical protein
MAVHGVLVVVMSVGIRVDCPDNDCGVQLAWAAYEDDCDLGSHDGLQWASNVPGNAEKTVDGLV